MEKKLPVDDTVKKMPTCTNDIVLLKKEEFIERDTKYREERKAIDAKIDGSYDKIRWHEKRIERLKAKRSSLKYPSWTEDYLRPILEELARLTPDITWDFERLSVFGLRCDCPVFGKNREQITTGITFTHHNGQLYYDTGETKNNYDPNTIGGLNGFNKVSAPVESIETLLVHVSKVIEEEKQALSTIAHEKDVVKERD